LIYESTIVAALAHARQRSETRGLFPAHGKAKGFNRAARGVSRLKPFIAEVARPCGQRTTAVKQTRRLSRA
jgi:hypothetical protein